MLFCIPSHLNNRGRQKEKQTFLRKEIYFVQKDETSPKQKEDEDEENAR